MPRFTFCPTTSTDQGSPVSYNYYHILQYLLEQTALLNGDVCVDTAPPGSKKKYLDFVRG